MLHNEANWLNDKIEINIIMERFLEYRKEKNCDCKLLQLQRKRFRTKNENEKNRKSVKLNFRNNDRFFSSK